MGESIKFKNDRYLSSTGVWDEGAGKTLTLDHIYPVGSIYLSVNNVNPSTYFGGTWEAYGAADTYLRLGGTGTGGSNTTKLTAAQIPTLTTGTQSANHTHSVTGGAHSHTLGTNDYFHTGNSSTASYSHVSGRGSWNFTSTGTTIPSTSSGHTHTVGNNSANHTHTYTNNAQTDVAIEPKYIQTYAWKRTA